MLYYTNLLDSVLFEGKFSGHNMVKLKSNIPISDGIKEEFHERFYTERYDNDFVAEYIIGSIIPFLLTNKENQLVATMNQIADNKAIIADLGNPTGEIDVIKTVKELFNEDKLLISIFESNEEEFPITNYIYTRLISSFYRIFTPSDKNNQDEAIEFISSLFPELGHQNFTSRAKFEKAQILLGDLYGSHEFKIFKKNVPKEEKEFISNIDSIIDSYVEQSNRESNLILGYISALKYRMKHGKFTNKIEDSGKCMMATFKTADQSYQKKIESLYSLDTAAKEHTRVNMQFTKQYEFIFPEQSKFQNISKNENITTKVIKALLNNKNFYYDRLGMYLTIFPKEIEGKSGRYSQRFLDEVSECVYEILVELCKKTNGGRSAFIKNVEDILEKIVYNYSEINEYLEMEKEKKNLLKGKGKKSLNFTIKKGVVYITREMINCAYNIGYCMLASKDKKMFEADGMLTSDGRGNTVWTITNIFDRKYDIKGGILVMEEEEIIL